MGTSATVPPAMPVVAMASARARRVTNQRAIGTTVSSCPAGAPNPESPVTAKMR